MSKKSFSPFRNDLGFKYFILFKSDRKIIDVKFKIIKIEFVSMGTKKFAKNVRGVWHRAVMVVEQQVKNVLVLWSVCLPSISRIQVRILLKSTMFFFNNAV